MNTTHSKTTAATAGAWSVPFNAPWSVWCGDKQIASCRWLADDAPLQSGLWAPECVSDKEARANAVIIAAAPKLAEALQIIESLCVGDSFAGFRAIARDALAKAGL